MPRQSVMYSSVANRAELRERMACPRRAVRRRKPMIEIVNSIFFKREVVSS